MQKNYKKQNNVKFEFNTPYHANNQLQVKRSYKVTVNVEIHGFIGIMVILE